MNITSTIRFVLMAFAAVLIALAVVINTTEAAIDERSEYVDATATTTLTPILTTASSTITARIAGASGVDFNICATGSSSAAILRYRLQYTTDTNQPSTTTTWFQETRESVSAGVVTHSLAEHNMSLATSTVSTNHICISLPNTPPSAKWVRVQMGAAGANAMIWRQIAPKSEL